MVGQLIDESLELTLPLPVPVRLTVSVKRCTLNAAVTDFAALMVIVQVMPEGVSHPLQPPKVDPLAALAVSVTLVPLSYVAVQVAPQLIDPSPEVTVPFPNPAVLTVSVTRWLGALTVSVVLALAPEPSVAVIVAVPACWPVASPLASMVATSLLLLQVTPVPVITTGVEELVVVPFPNWPNAL